MPGDVALVGCVIIVYLMNNYSVNCYCMRTTSALEKLIPSLINVSLIIALSLPIAWWFGFGVEWKMSAIISMYLFQVFDTHRTRSFQCFGMRIFGTVWQNTYSQFQRNTYSLLYTLSFSSVFFSVWFPFDLLLFNLFCVQLPCIYLTGTTCHGYLAGNMVTVISIKTV